ncbi:MAG: S8 family serine peptidase [Rhizobacter sp.]|nr:S8 family serine peptidase [Bacteriovorax sp.]
MKSLITLILVLNVFALYGCKSSSGTSSTAATVAPRVALVGPDPLLSYQWHLDNTGQSAFSSTNGTVGADIDIDNLFSLGFTGKGVVVAVSDTNIEVDHEDLYANVSIPLSRNYLNSSSASWPGNKPWVSGNTSEHGTSVMGLIGAVANNAVGGRGVAPGVTLAGFNFIESTQSLSRYLDQAKGAIDVFNYSYGTDTCTVVPIDSTYITQLKYGVTSQRSGKGSIYVKAAGNEYFGNLGACNATYEGNAYLGNANLEQVNAFPYTILAAALTSGNVLTEYSSPGSNLWISAPGGEDGVTKPGIISTDLTGCSKGYSKSNITGTNSFDTGVNPLNAGCNYTSTLEGTSFSSPITAGTVALMLQANPALTWRDVKHILASTAVKVDPTSTNSSHPMGASHDLAGHIYERGWTHNAAGYWFHNWYGFGALDAKAAVLMAETYTSHLGTMVESLFSSGAISQAIPDHSAAGTTNTINVTSNLVVESIQLTVNVTHAYPGELGIEITSPSGTVSNVMNINSGMIATNLSNALFLSNAFYGETSSGNWTIKVIDGEVADTGTLTSWKINVYGHAP